MNLGLVVRSLGGVEGRVQPSAGGGGRFVFIHFLSHLLCARLVQVLKGGHRH